jgi:hypothetical protein
MAVGKAMDQFGVGERTVRDALAQFPDTRDGK